MNLVKKTDEGNSESINLLNFVLWGCFDCQWVRGDGVGQLPYLGLAEIAYFVYFLPKIP